MTCSRQLFFFWGIGVVYLIACSNDLMSNFIPWACQWLINFTYWNVANIFIYLSMTPSTIGSMWKDIMFMKVTSVTSMKLGYNGCFIIWQINTKIIISNFCRQARTMALTKTIIPKSRFSENNFSQRQSIANSQIANVTFRLFQAPVGLLQLF